MNVPKPVLSAYCMQLLFNLPKQNASAVGKV